MQTSILTFEQVSYRYEQDRQALDRVSCSIGRHRKTAIVGANGAGKSTLVLHMNGIYLPEAGVVSYEGEPITKHNRSRIKTRVGVIFQDPDDQLLALTVFEDVSFTLVQRGLSRDYVRQRTRETLQHLHITEWATRSPLELSYGEKKWVAIAGVLAADPEVFIFDEPMAFLDPVAKNRIKQLMNELSSAGKTVIVTTHDMQLVADWAEDCVIMKEGRCIDVVSPRELFTDEKRWRHALLDLPPIAALASTLWDDVRDGDRSLHMPIRQEEMRAWLQQWRTF